MRRVATLVLRLVPLLVPLLVVVLDVALVGCNSSKSATSTTSGSIPGDSIPVVVAMDAPTTSGPALAKGTVSSGRVVFTVEEQDAAPTTAIFSRSR